MNKKNITPQYELKEIYKKILRNYKISLKNKTIDIIDGTNKYDIDESLETLENNIVFFKKKVTGMEATIDGPNTKR